MEEVNINDEINQLAGRQYRRKLDWDPILKDTSTSDQSRYLESPAGHGQAIGKEDTETMVSSHNFVLSLPTVRLPDDVNQPLDYKKLCSSFMDKLVDTTSALVTTVTATKVEKLRQIHDMDLDIKKEELQKAKEELERAKCETEKAQFDSQRAKLESESAELQKKYHQRKFDYLQPPPMATAIANAIPTTNPDVSIEAMPTQNKEHAQRGRGQSGKQRGESGDGQGESKTDNEDKKRKRNGGDDIDDDVELNNPKRAAATTTSVPKTKDLYTHWTWEIDMDDLPEYKVGKIRHQDWALIFSRFPPHYKEEFCTLVREGKESSKKILKKLDSSKFLYFLNCFKLILLQKVFYFIRAIAKLPLPLCFLFLLTTFCHYLNFLSLSFHSHEE